MVFTRKHGDFHGLLLLVSGRVTFNGPWIWIWITMEPSALVTCWIFLVNSWHQHISNEACNHKSCSWTCSSPKVFNNKNALGFLGAKKEFISMIHLQDFWKYPVIIGRLPTQVAAWNSQAQLGPFWDKNQRKIHRILFRGGGGSPNFSPRFPTLP